MVAVTLPTFKEERELLARGFTIVAGVDEVGCGCWAGPVYAGAVILPFDSRIGLVRDSKTLSLAQRERVSASIKEEAAAWAVGSFILPSSISEVSRRSRSSRNSSSSTPSISRDFRCRRRPSSRATCT